MKEPSCEDVLIAQMAVADGEEPELSTDELGAHITNCAACRQQLEQSQALDQVLAGHVLRETRVDLWPAIETRIGKRSIDWKPFGLIGLLLILYKLLEMVPAREPGMAFKLVPLVIVVLLFVLIKENPFRINTELAMER